ncbi:MAG TPA: zf-HC2 domain-containing protein [Candidatus Limnocylindrales bacterium]|nr:zf-HC2 domain-containing protein [Candidatus Limnocylindrales bacterium]
MKAHDRCQLLVATALDFDLDPAEQRLVDRHLATCSTCPAVAQTLASDAATIAALPRAIRTAPGGPPPRPAPARRAGQPTLRLVAIAALLALLVLGALAAGGELIRRLEESTRLALNPSPRVPTQVDTSRSQDPAGPSAGPSAAPTPPPCVAAPTIEDLATNGGAWAVGCYGSAPIEGIGYIPFGDGANACEGWEPQWLACPSGSFLATHAGRDAPLLTYAHDGDLPVVRPPDGPDSVDGQPLNGHFARFTGHFGDPAAGACRAVRADAPLFNDRPALQRHCRETFVVTALTLLVGADVPPPVVDARWTVSAGQAALAAPPSTVLQSIVEAGGQWFVLGFDNSEGRSTLWRSADARSWEPVSTDGYAPSRIASDGTRLFGITGGDPSEIRTSLDGRSWTLTPGLPAGAHVTCVATTGHGVFAGGGIGIDAAVWGFDAGRWVQVDLPDAKGWLGDQDASPALVRGIADLAGSVGAFGDAPAETGFGFGLARLWHSKDGVTWVKAPFPAADAASAIGGLTRSDGISTVIVGSKVNPIGPASWATRAGEWISGSFPEAGRVPTASLIDLVEARGVLVAVGLAPTQTDSLDVVVWGSNDGITWSPLSSGDLNGGFVNDLVSTGDGRVLAVGWQSGTTGSERGPAVWELLPTAGT